MKCRKSEYEALNSPRQMNLVDADANQRLYQVNLRAFAEEVMEIMTPEERSTFVMSKEYFKIFG